MELKVRNKYRYHLIDDFESKLNSSKKVVESYEEKQKALLTEVSEINTFLAKNLENKNNHTNRKQECKEKISEIKTRISAIKETFNQAKNILSKYK